MPKVEKKWWVTLVIIISINPKRSTLLQFFRDYLLGFSPCHGSFPRAQCLLHFNERMLSKKNRDASDLLIFM